MKIESTSDALKFLYKLSLDESNLRFRGQADFSWSLKPTIYRYEKFERYQTVDYESNVLLHKPPKAIPPLTHTEYDLEWLMLCQHYGVPTRLLDWTTDILMALFFACSAEAEIDGAIFVCDQNDYPKFSAYDENARETQSLLFVNTNIVNPRVRMQSGCFMMWGHAPLDNIKSTESYDLWEYHEHSESKYYLKKITIPRSAKSNILKELNDIYSITQDNIYLQSGYFEKNYGALFLKLKETARLMSLYKTNADRLTTEEEKFARSFFKVDCRNMIGNCSNLTKIG